jgi:hypothetical protein
LPLQSRWVQDHNDRREPVIADVVDRAKPATVEASDVAPAARRPFADIAQAALKAARLLSPVQRNKSRSSPV